MEIDIDFADGLVERFGWGGTEGDVVDDGTLRLEYVACEHGIGEGRWQKDNLIVFRLNGEHVGLIWQEGLTEMQWQKPFEYIDPELVPVEPYVKMHWRTA